MDIVLAWLILFFFVIVAKIIWVKQKGTRKEPDSMVFTEAIGLPITFGQPIVFAKALLIGDWIGALATLWWGPGFLFIIALVIWSKVRHHTINWGKFGLFISWSCKITYLVYIGLALLWHMPKLVFALSAWIASDQIEKAFASLDADRARRCFHDSWWTRVLYPAFLLSPWWNGLGFVYKGYGTVLLITWLVGLAYVWRQGEFMMLPDDPTLLRNLPYFSSKSKKLN